MAMFLVSSGADLTIVNTSNQTPLQLCADPNLIKLLEQAQQEHKIKQTGTHAAHQSLHVCSTIETDVHVRCSRKWRRAYTHVHADDHRAGFFRMESIFVNWHAYEN